MIGFSGILARLPALLAARARPAARSARALAARRRGARGLPGLQPAPRAAAQARAACRSSTTSGRRCGRGTPSARGRWRAGWTASRWCSRSRRRSSATAGVPTTFVGHPLLDELAPEVDEARRCAGELGAAAGRAARGPAAGQPPRRARAPRGRACWTPARRLRERHPDVFPVLALAEGASLARRARGAAARRSRWCAGARAPCRRTPTCCAVASGTATLETALLGTPLVVCYRVGWLNYADRPAPRDALAHRAAEHRRRRGGGAGAAAGARSRRPRLAETLGGWLADPAALARAARRARGGCARGWAAPAPRRARPGRWRTCSRSRRRERRELPLVDGARRRSSARRRCGCWAGRGGSSERNAPEYAGGRARGRAGASSRSGTRGCCRSPTLRRARASPCS